MNTQHIVQLLQQALQELQQQPQAQTPQPIATAPAAAPAPVIEESRSIVGEVGTHTGDVFDADPQGNFKLSNRGERMTGFFCKLEGGGGCFVKAFGEACDTITAASVVGYTTSDPPKPIYGPGVRFKAYLNIQPAPGKRNPYRHVSNVEIIEKVVQF